MGSFTCATALSLTHCNSVPVFLPALHTLTVIQVLSLTHDALQLHLQDTPGDTNKTHWHESTPTLILTIFMPSFFDSIQSLYLCPVSSTSSSFLTSCSLSSCLLSLCPAASWARTPFSSSLNSLFFDLRAWFRCSASFACCSISEISASRAFILFTAALTFRRTNLNKDRKR